MKLDGERLQKLYPEMEEDFAQRMKQLIHSLPSQKEDEKVKRWTFQTVIVWALLAMLCMVTAHAVIQYGLDWYYNTRFTAYQEHEPNKHAAIMEHLQTGLSQRVTGDERIHVQVAEASWAQEEQVLVVALTAVPRDAEAYELHPMWNLDADGAYAGEGGTATPSADGEDRSVHWLWTREGFGPVEEMIAPGKQLLLLETGDVHLGGKTVLGDGSSMDAFVTEDGAVHTVLEVRLEMLADGYEERMRRQIADAPAEHAVWLEERLKTNLDIRRAIEEDQDGVITFSIPFTTTLYTQEDQQLYQGGQEGAISFELKIR